MRKSSLTFTLNSMSNIFAILVFSAWFSVGESCSFPMENYPARLGLHPQLSYTFSHFQIDESYTRWLEYVKTGEVQKDIKSYCLGLGTRWLLPLPNAFLSFGASLHYEVETKHFMVIHSTKGEIDAGSNGKQTRYSFRSGLWGEISEEIHINNYVGFSVFGKFYFKEGLDWMDAGGKLLLKL
jgi:hypothetical protein